MQREDWNLHQVAWNEDPVLRILYYGSVTLDPRWAHRLHDPYWRLYLNDHPGATLHSNTGSIHLSPGRIHLIPPWGNVQSACKGSVLHRYLHLDLGDWCRQAQPVSVHLPNLDRLRQLCDLPHWSACDRLRAGALVWEALAEAVATGALPLSPAVPDPIERARRFLWDHLSEPVPLQALAQVAGLSASHLRARFSEALGCSPAQWQRERRIARASQLLVSSAQNIEEIAQACGFANRYHFSRVFTGFIGQGPASYRRQQRRLLANPRLSVTSEASASAP